MLRADKIRELESKKKRAVVVDILATVLLFVWLHTKYIADPTPLHPILENESVVKALLVLGVLGTVWGAFRMVTLINQKANLINDDNI